MRLGNIVTLPNKMVGRHNGSKHYRFLINEETGCWECISHSKAKDGYTVIRVDDKVTKLHRHIYELHYGKIASGLVVRHKCDNRGCCNPNHLELGTQKDNMNDMKIRGRSGLLNRTGKNHPKSISIVVLDLNYNIVETFNSLTETMNSKYVTCGRSVSYVMDGEVESHNGYIFIRKKTYKKLVENSIDKPLWQSYLKGEKKNRSSFFIDKFMKYVYNRVVLKNI